MIKIGMIGAGVVSNGHLQELKTNPNVEISAIADLNKKARETLAQRYEAKKTVSDYQVLLDDKSIDLIYVCTPHHLHYPMVIDALQSGKHVICEKPIAISLKEADEMIEEAKKTGRRFFVALNHRFDPTRREAKALLEKEEIGKPFLTISNFLGDELERMNDPENWKGTREKSGGGVLIDAGTHMIDIARSYFGEVKSVLAKCERLTVKAENKAEDTAVVILDFANGVVANLTVTLAIRFNLWNMPGVGCNIAEHIYGTEGSIHVTNHPQRLLTVTRQNKKEKFDLAPDMYEGMNEHFINCLLNNKEPLVTSGDAREALAVIMAAYESTRKGERVFLPGFATI